MSVNLTNRDECTPLHFCAELCHLEVTKTLVEGGSATSNTNKYGNNSLLMAALNGRLEIFCYLTEFGVDINIRNANNKSVLHLAAESGTLDIIKLFLDKKCLLT